jgi:hypothetical protein
MYVQIVKLQMSRMSRMIYRQLKSESLENIDEGSDLKKSIPMDVNRTYRKEVDGEVVELDNIFIEDSSA